MMNRRWAGCLLATAAALTIAAPLAAQQPGSAFSGYRDNANKPINIEADVLEVDDKNQVATFRGNVSAQQGDFLLRSRELEVVYARGGEQADGAAPQKAAAADGDPFAGGDIRFIRARGKVLVTSKDNQTATSEEAFFDVKAQQVTLERDVTLTQAGNIIKGEKLLIDIVSGRSTFEQGAGGKQRLRAVFSRPESTNKSRETSGGQAPPQPAPRPPAASGWQPQ